MHTPMFSLEVFPPKRTSPVGTIYDTLDGLNDMKPDFISVTYGTGKSADRTATARIAHTIRSEYGIDAVAPPDRTVPHRTGCRRGACHVR